jgi:hypothetical protein
MRARRIRQKLDGEPVNTAPFPWKPPGMRWATYGALYHEAVAAERAWAEAQQRDVTRMLERSGAARLSPAAAALLHAARLSSAPRYQ